LIFPIKIVLSSAEFTLSRKEFNSNILFSKLKVALRREIEAICYENDDRMVRIQKGDELVLLLERAINNNSKIQMFIC
jgi:hypothetical protein